MYACLLGLYFADGVGLVVGGWERVGGLESINLDCG